MLSQSEIRGRVSDPGILDEYRSDPGLKRSSGFGFGSGFSFKIPVKINFSCNIY